MYQIKCDGLVLYDPRDDDLIVDSPKVNLEVNTIGEGSFTIHENHPYYGDLKKLKSVFEVSDEIGVIFRGRMTNNSYDFHNSKFVDLEGAMGYFNDSIVRPYAFPEDWENDSGYIAAANSGNVIAFFLNWLIEQHNEQVQEFQRFKLGNVTVTDPNNYLSRSDFNYPKTWDVLKSKLFNSALGGYLCIRYEADGNYIDYLSDFELVNTQEIVFGENLLDLKTDSDANETYSAIIPIGAKIETDSSEKVLTIADLPDGLISGDFYKKGDAIYSANAVSAYGWVYAPVSVTTWDDITEAANLRTKGVAFLASDGMLLSESMEAKAVDLHFTDAQVQSFRIYRKVKLRSDVHGYSGTYQMPKLGLDLHNPQNTVITIGATRLTLTESNSQKESQTAQRIESAEKDIAENRVETNEVRNQIVTQSTELINTCNQIFMSALESYVETSNFEEFKATLKAELEVFAAGITGRVTETESSIKNVDGDLQEKYNLITKYFTFDINGLQIGSVDEDGNVSPNKVVIDNDDITILVNNMPIQTFRADGTAMIPDLKIKTSMNLLGLNITQDESHINCDYIGAVT